MRPEQRPPTVAIAAALLYLLVVFVPYVASGDAEPGVLEAYYDAFGVVGPQFLSLLVVVAIVLFAAGRELRTEPDYVAGLTLVIGVVLVVFVALWSIAVTDDVATGLSDAAWVEYHRWLVLACSLAIPLSAVWYARTLELL